jgi:hypothetical protein
MVAIAAAVVLLLWLAVSVRMANNRGKRDSVDRASYAFAMAAMPLFDMNSKGQIPDSATLERLCDDMVGPSGAFSLAAMLDGNGNVLACSDRKFVAGSKFPGFQEDKVILEETRDGWQAMRPASRGTVRYGTIVLRLR